MVVIKYYKINDLKQIYEEKKQEVLNQYEHQKELVKRRSIPEVQRKAQLTRLHNSTNDKLSHVEGRYGAIANGADDIVLSSYLKEMYERYTGKQFNIDDVMVRRDLTEFYIDIDERKRMWVSYISQYKYKCTIDNKCMGKGTRYQRTPIITFEDYNGQQINT